MRMSKDISVQVWKDGIGDYREVRTLLCPLRPCPNFPHIWAPSINFSCSTQSWSGGRKCYYFCPILRAIFSSSHLDQIVVSIRASFLGLHFVMRLNWTRYKTMPSCQMSVWRRAIQIMICAFYPQAQLTGSAQLTVNSQPLIESILM